MRISLTEERVLPERGTEMAEKRGERRQLRGTDEWLGSSENRKWEVNKIYDIRPWPLYASPVGIGRGPINGSCGLLGPNRDLQERRGLVPGAETRRDSGP